MVRLMTLIMLFTEQEDRSSISKGMLIPFYLHSCELIATLDFDIKTVHFLLEKLLLSSLYPDDLSSFFSL